MDLSDNKTAEDKKKQGMEFPLADKTYLLRVKMLQLIVYRVLDKTSSWLMNFYAFYKNDTSWWWEIF